MIELVYSTVYDFIAIDFMFGNPNDRGVSPPRSEII